MIEVFAAVLTPRSKTTENFLIPNMKYVTKDDEEEGIFNNVAAPVTLDHMKRRLPLDFKDEIFNDSGLVVRGKAESGEDIHLWNFIYQQQGREVVVDGDVAQLLLVYGKFTDDQKQYMNPEAAGVNKGQLIDDYYKPGTIKITEEKDKVVWKLDKMEHHCAPPVWQAIGESAGVKVDLKFEQSSPAFWHLGTFETQKEVGMAGYVAHCRVSGTIEVDGKVLTLKDQYGLHERIQHKGKVPDRTGHMSGRGLHWMHGWSEGFSWYLMRGDVGKGLGTAMINIGDEQILLEDPTSSGVEEAANWIDPVSKIVSPYRWRAWVRTDKGTLESRIKAYGRQYYTWTRRGGTLVVNQYCADAETEFRYPDGRTVTAKQVVSIEHMRTLYRQLANWEQPGGPDHLYP